MAIGAEIKALIRLKQILWRHRPESAFSDHIHWFRRSEQHCGRSGAREYRQCQLDVREFYILGVEFRKSHQMFSCQRRDCNYLSDISFCQWEVPSQTPRLPDYIDGQISFCGLKVVSWYVLSPFTSFTLDNAYSSPAPFAGSSG